MTTKEQVLALNDKCEQLKNCKFIMATTKIGEVLKAIVNGPELYQLFKTVTKDYDYIAARKKCFVTRTDGVVSKSFLVLPDMVGERLAFIFCLLVEFDNNTLNFNDFLQQFYAEDGSYFASFHSFCDDVIVSLQNLIFGIFEEELKQPSPEEEKKDKVENESITANPDRASRLSLISLLIANEKDFVLHTQLSDEEKATGESMLTELEKAVQESNVSLIDCLLSGYHYFIMYHNIIGENVSALIENIGEYEALL